LNSKEYRKFFYWIPPEAIEKALSDTKSQLGRSEIPVAKQRQCESLNPTMSIMYVPPAVWSTTCIRQGSWYRTSELRNDHLIVSNLPLILASVKMSGSISIIDIENIFPISKEKVDALVHSEEFKSKVPDEWFHFLEFEPPLFLRYITNHKLNVSLDEFLVLHSANHANFMLKSAKDRISCEVENEKITCSLFEAEFICSACMQIFGVIGANLKKMVIKNCPGLKYVKLEPHEYFFMKVSN
jgi:hypothetical protein